MTFYTPEPVVMMKSEAEQAGYQAMTTARRLVVRSPYSTAETYPEDVSGMVKSFIHTINRSRTEMPILGGRSPNGGFQSWHLPQVA